MFCRARTSTSPSHHHNNNVLIASCSLPAFQPTLPSSLEQYAKKVKVGGSVLFCGVSSGDAQLSYCGTRALFYFLHDGWGGKRRSALLFFFGGRTLLLTVNKAHYIYPSLSMVKSRARVCSSCTCAGDVPGTLHPRRYSRLYASVALYYNCFRNRGTFTTCGYKRGMATSSVKTLDHLADGYVW